MTKGYNKAKIVVSLTVLSALFLGSCMPFVTQAEKPSKADMLSKVQTAPPATDGDMLTLPDVDLPGGSNGGKGSTGLAPGDDGELFVDNTPASLDSAHFEDDGKYIILNFDGLDIRTVIATFAELLEFNYILSSKVSGQVTIQSYKKFPTRDLYHIFQTVLEINGLTAIEDGPFYRILPIADAVRYSHDVREGKAVRARDDQGFVIQLIPLDYVKASEVRGILQKYSPQGTDIEIYEPANMLIVTAQPRTLAKFMSLLDAIDVSDSDRATLRTYVYYVENGEADKLGKILKEIYKTDTKSVAAPAISTTPSAPTVPGRPPRPTAAPTTTAPEAFAAEVGEIEISAYEDINALIIKTTPRGYLSVRELLGRIDVPVKQVLIEVLIASVRLDDDTSLGIEWFMRNAKGGDAHFGGGFTQGSVSYAGPGQTTPTGTAGDYGEVLTNVQNGFSAFITGIIDSNIFSTVINALVSMGNLNVIASPHILAMDNKEAKIEIGSEEPIATGMVQQPGTAQAGTTLVTSGQIQYKTIGTILNVKPHITEKNRVTLKIEQEVSDIGPDRTLGQTGTFSSFLTRKATTTAVVESGHTLVLGGLIEETATTNRTGIPVLSKIPLIGWLFSTNTETKRKQEYIVMVTPHVISGTRDADRITAQFQNKVRLIKSNIEEQKMRHEIERVRDNQ